jgi:DNA-binding transcriptional LysR family regulator
VTLQQTLLGTPEGRWFAPLVDKAHPVLATNSRAGQLAAARAGLGLACLPRYLADPHADLARLDAPKTPPRREIWLGVHKDARWTPRIRAVLDHLAAALAAAAPALAPERCS